MEEDEQLCHRSLSLFIIFACPLAPLALMKKIYLFLTIITLTTAIAGCKKTPDYVPMPYSCGCGTINWQGASLSVLDANYILTDSTLAESRRYYITADVPVLGEYEAHGLNTIVEIDTLDGGGNFYVQESSGLEEYRCVVQEFNANDPTTILRELVPVEGTLNVVTAPITGGNETISFQMVLREYYEGNLVGPDINYSGNFVVYIND
jgi:hypothetical protein